MTDTSQTAVIYERLRAGILSLDMTPGERLTERGLETELSASRTPVRAALTRLEAEGLMQRDGRGWMVAPIDLAETRDLLEYREIIEAAAIGLAISRATDAELASLDLMLEAVDPSGPGEEVLRAGTDFHVEVARLSQNPFLVAAATGSMTRLARTRWLEVQTEASRAHSRDGHRAIVAAMRQRDALTAERLAVEHIRQTREHLLATLEAERRRLRARGFAVV
ncbi:MULTISPECIES: GntR family transcriptional regulator [Subtercola]|uniref:GntR family transcriptional regulator n=1 Tax=Subtercola vilae TaxID=2056433 RepID=A0A4T2C509_9MICO|nr:MULTISPECIES: GntR family transcriptional regulator [Subtercola]MEA9986531.1 GntR family transcriptional regulator [Subtercola sp. RTI3]TIH38291.1 GntR family transcriptional regulator [Subtercola vilae]